MVLRVCVVAPLLLAIACGGSPGEPGAARVRGALALDARIPTVGVVTASTDAEAVVWVEYGPDTDYGRRTPATTVPGVEHALRVVGMPAGETTHWRLVAEEADGTVVYGEDAAVTLDPAPRGVPEIAVLADDGAAFGDYTLIALGWGSPLPMGAVVLDPEGRAVWYELEDSGRFVTWAEFSRDGRSIVYLRSSDDHTATSEIVVTALDGSSTEVIPAPFAHHTLAQVGDHGVRFAYVAAEVREVDGAQVAGDRVVEVLDDGNEREIWNAFEHIPAEVEAAWEMETPYGAVDWTHGNGLHYDAASDAYYLSLYQHRTVVCIDRATGEDRWRLGGDGSRFELVGDTGFSRQHGPERTGDSLLVFDNNGQAMSRAEAWRLDEANRTATLAWALQTPEGDGASILGDVDAPVDGQVVTAWGDLGQVIVFGEDGTVHRRFDAEPGAVVGGAEVRASLYE